MKQVSFNVKQGEVNINFPTTIKEITPEYLNGVTKHITVAPYHTLVGLVYHTKLSAILLGSNKLKGQAKIGVVPIFIQHGVSNDDSFLDDACPGDKLLITHEQLALGVHVAVPANRLTLQYFEGCVKNSIEPNLYDKLTTQTDNDEVMFIEFKIVNDVDVTAIYKDCEYNDSPFVSLNPRGPEC